MADTSAVNPPPAAPAPGAANSAAGAHAAAPAVADPDVVADLPLDDPPRTPAAVDLRMLAPAQQRALLRREPGRIAAVTHVAAPEHDADSLLLIVRDGPTNVEVTNLPAPRASPLSPPAPGSSTLDLPVFPPPILPHPTRFSSGKKKKNFHQRGGVRM